MSTGVIKTTVARAPAAQLEDSASRRSESPQSSGDVPRRLSPYEFSNATLELCEPMVGREGPLGRAKLPTVVDFTSQGITTLTPGCEDRILHRHLREIGGALEVLEQASKNAISYPEGEAVAAVLRQLDRVADSLCLPRYQRGDPFTVALDQDMPLSRTEDLTSTLYKFSLDALSIMGETDSWEKMPLRKVGPRALTIVNLLKTKLEECLDDCVVPWRRGCLENPQIHEYSLETGFPPFAVCNQLLEIERTLLIDPHLRKPQNGLLCPISEEELQHILSSKGARLITYSLKNEMIGYYVFFTERSSLPDPGKAAFAAIEKDRPEILTGKKVGWVEEVAISSAGRNLAKELGLSGYEMLHELMAASSVASVHTLLARVRSGDQANLAAHAHERVGWRDTGTIIECDTASITGPEHPMTPYKVIALELSSPVPRVYAL